jgi:predicted solute-binding protein
MLLLPVAHALGILCITEVSLVGRLGQPGLLRDPLPGLAALWFEAIPLTLGVTVIRKKKIFAVQALTTAAGRFHRFQSPKEPVSKRTPDQRKKILSEEDSERRRRKKSFQ